MKTPLALLCLVLVLVSCSGSKPAPANTADPTQAAVATIAKMGNLAVDPFAQMSLSFDGNPPPELIKDKLDRVLQMYGVELSDTNRGQAGRTLTSLRKETGHSEIDILDKMLDTPANGTPFEQAAATITTSMNQ